MPPTDLRASDPYRLAGRSAVVVGGAGGLGGAICAELAAAGAAVVVADRDAGAAERVAAGLRASGAAAEGIALDATDPAAHGRAAGAAATLGPLRAWCNAAGVPAAQGPVGELGADAFRAAFDAHVLATVFGCQAAAPAIAAAGGGAILNLASSVADLPMAGNAPYTIAKVGVVALTRVLALELGSQGVRVNALAPGAVATGFTGRYYTDADGTVDEEARDAWRRQMARLGPLGTPGTADDQALLARYLLSDAARFVTGQVVRANGGWTFG